MTDFHLGGCHCGAVRYRLEGALHDIAHCHCSICRRVSGGTVTTWITVQRQCFQWLSALPAQYASSANCVRYFCGNCGAQVALVTQLSPETVDVTIATLDHPELAIPERHIWTDNRLPWLHLDEHLPGEPGETL
ncbi:Glutathione-dependent formaldehyde-activating enzyme [compost metagenome]